MGLVDSKQLTYCIKTDPDYKGLIAQLESNHETAEAKLSRCAHKYSIAEIVIENVDLHMITENGIVKFIPKQSQQKTKQ